MLHSSLSKNIVLWDKASRIFTVSSLSFRGFHFFSYGFNKFHCIFLIGTRQVVKIFGFV